MRFTIKDKTFDTGVMSAKKQFHVLRRLLPLIDGVKDMLDGDEMRKLFREGADHVRLSEIELAPLAEKLASLPDADFDYIMDACLDVTEMRQDGGGFAPVRKNGAVMFPLDLTVTMAIVWHVLRENYTSFFADLRSVLPVMAGGPTSNG